MHIVRIALLWAFALMLQACSTTLRVGNDFDAAALAQKIERGVTTREQVRAWLGAPTNSGRSMETDGRQYDEWTYYYAAGRLPDMSSPKMKLLQIKFDKQGVVQGYNWSASE